MIAALLERCIDAVVIGASAGGVEALSALLPAVPASYRGVILIVLHLPRERPSLLVSIFAPKCALAVVEAEDKLPIAPGTIYFAPPDYHLLVDDGPSLALSADEPVHYSRPSIDVLFESAADIYGPHLAGVILTGASSDGTHGLEAVHRSGGLTLVQRPDTAQVPVMVESAIRQAPVDAILPLNELAAWLGGLTATAAPVVTDAPPH